MLLQEDSRHLDAQRMLRDMDARTTKVFSAKTLDPVEAPSAHIPNCRCVIEKIIK